MKKITLLFASFAILLSSFAQNNTTNDIDPNVIKSYSNYDKAMWDIQLDVDPTGAAAGLAGVGWTGTEFWACVWQTNEIYTFDAAGVNTGNFTITGITGARSVTTDGTNMYIGNNTTSIYEVNPTTKTIVSTITAPVGGVRYCAYDPTLDGGNGGFWTGSFSSTTTAVSMSGTTLTSFNSGLAIYGMAYDPYTSGGPYLWAFNQDGNGADLTQLTMAGATTGLIHDATVDLQGGNSGIGGGLFICNNFIAGKNSMIGICQGASLFAYEISDPLAVDVELSSLNVPEYGLAGNLTISGAIKNMGLSTITSVDIAWDNGGPVNNETFTVNMAPGVSYNFSHATTLAVTAGSCDNLNVVVTLVGDLDPANDDEQSSHCGLTSIPSKTVVGEERTGTWCGWCPRGAVGLANMEAQNDFIGIAVHNGSNDPMRVTAYDSGINAYIPASFPGGGVDRVDEGNPSAANFLAMHNQRKTALVPCDVKNIVATYNTTTNQIAVSADSEWYGNISGNFRLSCVIVEDDVVPTTSQTDQVNYYSGGGNGSMAFPNGMNNNYDFGGASAPDPVAPSLFLGYDHTARSLSSNNILGDAGSLPAGTVTMGVHSHTFTNISLSTVDDVTKSHAVVMVVNSANGEILNAGEVPLTQSNVSVREFNANAFNLNVFPNPTSNVATVTFDLTEAASVKMEVINAIGSVVLTENVGVMNAGVQTFNFDGTKMPNGIYFVNLTIDGQIITKKVSLLK